MQNTQWTNQENNPVALHDPSKWIPNIENTLDPGSEMLAVNCWLLSEQVLFMEKSPTSPKPCLYCIYNI